jgi:pre-mRNA-processing factor 17
MSLLLGYDSDSASENERKESTSTDLSVNLIPSSSINVTKKSLSGQYQETIIDPHQFRKNKRLLQFADSTGNITESKRVKAFQDTKVTKAKIQEYKQRNPKKSKGDPSHFDGEEDAFKGSWPSSQSESPSESETEGDNHSESILKPLNIPVREFQETSKFYGNKLKNSSIFDYPADYEVRFATTIPGQKEYFVPKKLLSSFKAHNSAITSLEFLPNSGHMILSSGNDGMIKLWSTTKPKSLIRDYTAHPKSVKHVTFSSTGEEFISCSYDKTVKIWDTETGKVKYKHNINSNPNMCTFVPNNPSEFMVALDSKRVEHFDWRSGEMVQLYEHHESAVTWVEFLDDGTKFVTASDDRTLKVWDIRINMPIKYIQDHKQQAMPVVKRHPNGKHFVGQSMDNQILTYSSSQNDKFKKNNLKVFSGHKCAGYAIKMGFTPDGKTLFSGDSTGECFFWDWKTCKIINRIKVSKEVISCVDVHPLETSMMTMAGYDGHIYIYN